MVWGGYTIQAQSTNPNMTHFSSFEDSATLALTPKRRGNENVLCIFPWSSHPDGQLSAYYHQAGHSGGRSATDTAIPSEEDSYARQSQKTCWVLLASCQFIGVRRTQKAPHSPAVAHRKPRPSTAVQNILGVKSIAEAIVETWRNGQRGFQVAWWNFCYQGKKKDFPRSE